LQYIVIKNNKLLLAFKDVKVVESISTPSDDVGTEVSAGMVEELDIAELLSTWTTCKTLPAPLTDPVKAKVSARFMLSACILSIAITRSPLEHIQLMQ
jgi:hypothetical protein